MKRSLAIWAVAAAILAILPAAWAISAGKLYKHGEAAEEQGDTLTAYQDYYQAFQKKPTDERYKLAWERTRFPAADLWVQRGERLRDQGDDTGALTDFLRALEIDPSNELAGQDIQATRAKINAQSPSAPQAATPSGITMEQLAPPPQLKPLSAQPMITLHMVQDSRVVYQAIGKAAGINVIFDPSYASKRIQVDLNNVTYLNALRIVALISGTFWRPVTSNTIFVAEDTRGKHTELDELAVETFYLHNVAEANDFTDVQTVLRNLFQNARINGVSSENAIVMRGTPDELLLAHRLIADLDKPRPEVVIDLAVLEVSRDLIRNIGIQLPQTASINFQPSNYNIDNTSSTSTTTTGDSTGSTATGITLNTLAHLNSTNFAVTIGQAAVNLLLTDNQSHIVQDPQIRCSDGQEASLKIGERIPIATGSYSAPGLAATAAIGYAQTQFQYIDVGVDMDIKPIVHADDDVTLRSKITISATNGSDTIEGVTEPVITQRVLDHTVRLKNGEANLIGGMLQRQTTLAVSGIPGLAQLPLIKYLFGTRDKEVSTDEIVFLMIPHVIRGSDITPADVQEIDTGTQSDVAVRQIGTKAQLIADLKGQADNSPAPLPQAAPPAVAPVSPAQAAQQALANMRQQSDAGPPVSLTLTPPQTSVRPGSTFRMAVQVSGGHDVFSVPLQVQYDKSKLRLINVDLPGRRQPDFLGKDGQAITLVHRDDGNGDIDIAASRPPGVRGVSGSGTLCVLTFQATASGSASVAITRPVVRNSQQEVLPATGSQAVVHIQ